MRGVNSGVTLGNECEVALRVVRTKSGRWLLQCIMPRVRGPVVNFHARIPGNGRISQGDCDLEIMSVAKEQVQPDRLKPRPCGSLLARTARIAIPDAPGISQGPDES